MRRVGLSLLVVALLSASLVPLLVPANAQGDKRVYISEDDLIMFEYPADWTVIRLPLSVRLLSFLDPAAQANIDLRVDVVYPGTRGLAQNEYAGLSPTAVVQEFIRVLDGFYVFDPITVEQLLTKEVAYTFTDGGRILLLAMDLGRENIGLIVAYVQTGQVDEFLFDVLEVAQTTLYLGPEGEPQPGASEVQIVPAGPDVVPFILDPETGEIIDPASVAAPASATDTDADTATDTTPDADASPTPTSTPTSSPTPTLAATSTPTLEPSATPMPTATREPFGFGGPDATEAPTQEPDEPGTDDATNDVTDEATSDDASAPDDADDEASEDATDETSALPQSDSTGSAAQTVPVAFFDDSSSGLLTLLYADGTMTVLNQSLYPLDISGFQLVAPDRQYFDGVDFGYIAQRALLPGSCLVVTSGSQPNVVPSYCDEETTLVRRYLYDDADQRAFVWRDGITPHETFGVLRNGELVARCFVDDGACSFDMPVSFGGYLAQFTTE